MVRVKICGITNSSDAKASIRAGCDALGFVFYRKSARYITPDKANVMIKDLPKKIKKIGVFVNAKEDYIRRVARLCRLDMLQFHGNESVQFCRKFRNHKVIRAFRVRDKIELDKISRYRTYAYMFDTFRKDKFGGTGKKFNWNLLRSIDTIKKIIFLSGGLTDKNVGNAIKLIHPDWIDVSSSVEIRPGKKDHRKLKKFIRAVKSSAL
ncbi:MAG: phosphoribosylanthranilate isomerase [Candidatus Omnitrophica bacterium]|nr:phosphoribosylanthranilate isomerase [Candidatus Omnitrophota bacterium]